MPSFLRRLQFFTFHRAPMSCAFGCGSLLSLIHGQLKRQHQEGGKGKKGKNIYEKSSSLEQSRGLWLRALAPPTDGAATDGARAHRDSSNLLPNFSNSVSVHVFPPSQIF